MTAKTLLREALKLNEKDRKRLADDIWKTVEIDWNDPHLPEWQKAELEHRLQDARENPDDVVTWESVRKKLARRRRMKPHERGWLRFAPHRKPPAEAGVS